jgi:hypothetical protein
VELKPAGVCWAGLGLGPGCHHSEASACYLGQVGGLFLWANPVNCVKIMEWRTVVSFI